MRRSISLLVLASLLWAAAACSSEDGRVLPPPDPDQTTTSTTAPETPSIGSEVREVFSLFSPQFVEGSTIPPRFTCEGEGVSPPLDWVATPQAAELALVVRDRDAGGFVHWVLSGIDPVVVGIGIGGVPEGAVQAANSAGTVGWTPPCPPAGTGAHTYAFTLHALAEPLALPSGTPAEDAAAAVETASTAQATLTGTVAAG